MTCTSTCNADELQRILRPRRDVVVEESVAEESVAEQSVAEPDRRGGAEAAAPDATFRAVGGPFGHYRRTVHITGRGEYGELVRQQIGQRLPSPVRPWLLDALVDRELRRAGAEAGRAASLVRQQITYRLSVPVWSWFMTPLVRRELRRPRSDGSQPFWAPSERLDPRSGQVLGVLCLLSVVAGYLGTLLSQTITFAFDEFGAGLATQGNTLTAVRVGVLLALGIVALADRRGRRPMLLFAATAGCLAAAAGAASLGVWTYGASQTVSRSLSTAMFVLLLVIAAEEVPAGTRAYAVSVLTLAAGLGSGMVVWLLPLADLGLAAWRVLFLAPLLALPLVLFCARRLPESRRFSPARGEDPRRPDDAARRGRRAERLTWLGSGALMFSLFAAPASQFLNEFLRTERSFSASEITVFQLSINTPAAIGVLVGGRFSDVRGRRRIGAVGLVAGAAFTVMRYVQGGWPMWMWGVLAAVFGAMSVPVMGAFGGELFGTSSRARSNGQITVMGVIGSMIGLQIVGRFTDAGGDFGHVFAMVIGAPVIVALLILFALPETARRELEDLNPEDRPG
ncbi:MAG: MFS transporter [bacterium]|nr:MFS transporter [bacterium]